MPRPSVSLVALFSLAITSHAALGQHTRPSTESQPYRLDDTAELAIPSPSGGYFLRLVDKVGIRRFGQYDGFADEWGSTCLVEQDSATVMSLIVAHVRTYAVHGRILFGATTTGYYVLDLREPHGVPKTFETFHEWRNELDKLGVPVAIKLRNPDVDATTRPAMELRPWRYRFFRGVLGLSDGQMASALIMLAVLFSLGLGAIYGKKPHLGFLSLAAGAGAGIILQTVEDILCCGGVVVYAPVCYGCYRLAAWVRGSFNSSIHHRHGLESEKNGDINRRADNE